MRNHLISLLIAISLVSCTKKEVVLSVESDHESTGIELHLFEDGTFDLTFWGSAESSEFYTEDFSQFNEGKYLVLENKILLYTDSVFDSNEEAAKLEKFKSSQNIYLENRNVDQESFRFMNGTFPPIWHN